jgi:hypothetical protein
MKKWFERWQEFTGWLPVIVIFTVIGWVVFGALDPQIGPDRLGMLLDLPVFAAYGLAASGLAYLMWRRWSMRLTDEQLGEYWAALMRGERGALVVFVTNAAFYLSATWLGLWFLYPAR